MKPYKNSLSCEQISDIQSRLSTVLGEAHSVQRFAELMLERYSSYYAAEVRGAIRDGVREYQAQLRAAWPTKPTHFTRTGSREAPTDVQRSQCGVGCQE